MNYEVNHVYTFGVNKEYGDHEDFFRLIDVDGNETYLPKLKFQKEEPLPDSLKARVKFFNKEGIPVTGHFLPGYVNRFYRTNKDGRPAEYEFKVRETPSHHGDKFVLEDHYGIFYYLDVNDTLLAKGQKVICSFNRITDTYFNLGLVKSEIIIPFLSPQALFSNIGLSPFTAATFKRLLPSVLPQANEELESGSSLWIITALRSAVNHMADWMVAANMKRHYRLFSALLTVLHDTALYLLEDSRFMRNVSGERRRNLQAIVTECAEGLEPFQSTLEIVHSDQHCRYVESLLSKLRESGYLYHPQSKLSMLMLVLRTQPRLVHDYLGRLFETLMEWDLATWATEPFRSAFVDQLEIYIRQASKEIDLLPQADTEAESDRIEKTVTAIALQMLISGDFDAPIIRRNRSLFYRYISLLRPVKSDDLLDKAFVTLMGKNLPLDFNYDTIKEPLMLMTRAMVKPSDDALQLQNIHTYREGNVSLTIDSDGISLTRTDHDNAGRILPNGMMQWLSPQIFLEGVQSLSGSNLNNIEAHRKLWANIEKELFAYRETLHQEERHRRRAEIGDRVKIAIYPQEIEKGDNPRWAAMIDDPDFEPSQGFILRDDIVSYKLGTYHLDRDRITANMAFSDYRGRPYHFAAKVIDLDDAGKCHFSLQEDVAEQLSNMMDFNETYVAVIAGEFGSEYSAIAETGYGVFLRRDEGVEYHDGDPVLFRVMERAPGKIVGTIIDSLPREDGTDKVTAFKNLMEGIRLLEESEQEDEIDSIEILDADEALSREDITEIIEIIRYKAISSTTLLQAYDYLRLGRVLALLIKDDNLAGRLDVHAALLQMHQFYATNRRVDADSLEAYRPRVEGFPMLEMVFHRLELVSWLGDTERNPDLWNTVAQPRNLLETNIARMVLAYNMLPETPGETCVAAEDLKSKIAAMLGVNFEARQLKSYGRENQFVEFKSSIVFPPQKDWERKAKIKPGPDPERMQHILLKVIAGMLNSSGGTLYIGVSDSSRCEAGLHEDFQYYSKRKASIGQKTYTIKNADNIVVFLSNLVRETWNTSVANSIQISADEEASKDVIMVKVQPRTSPVELSGTVFVRQSTDTVPLLGEDLEQFLQERKLLEIRNREELRAAEAREASHGIDRSTPAQPTQANVETPKQNTPEVSKPAAAAQTPENAVATSLWHQKTLPLHEWEEHYVEPAGYIYIGDENSLRLSDHDLYCDLNEDNPPRCTIAYNRREAQSGFLILGFAPQKVLKIPMQEVLEKGFDSEIKFHQDSTLLFAAVALENDSLLTHLPDSKNNLYRRVTPLEEFENSHLNSAPQTICDLPGTGQMTANEIVPSSAMSHFQGSATKDLSTRQIGYALRAGVNTDKALQIFLQDSSNCYPK